VLPQKKHPLQWEQKSTAAEGFDGDAQDIILTVIFQAIDAKFCNRASFRHGVRNFHPQHLRSVGHPHTIELFAAASGLARQLQTCQRRNTGGAF
jgi:hypothetical protein